MLAELTNSEGKAGKASGQVLFFSTIGSVAGGIVTPVWLFPHLGVARTAYVVCAVLAAAAAVMAAGRFRTVKMAGLAAAVIMATGSASTIFGPQKAVYSFDSAYQSARILENKTAEGRVERVLTLGGGRASGIYADSGETSFPYVLEAEKALDELRPEAVLVIGAAGFTFPRDAARLPYVKSVDAVDVDPVVKPLAEKYFLRQPLPQKVRFLPLSARYAVRRLRHDGKRYGLAYVDAYFGQGIPDELVTLEFFRDVHLVSERTAVNMIMDRGLESAFAKNLLASFREGCGGVWVKDVRPGDSDLTNFLVTSWPAVGSAPWNGTGQVYRDDKSTADQDHVKLVWGPDES